MRYLLADPNERSIAVAVITALEDMQNGSIAKKLSKTALNSRSWERLLTIEFTRDCRSTDET
jgi:hypothetical protein